MTESDASRTDRMRMRASVAVRWLDHPLLPALIALIVGWSLFSGELRERKGDWSAFIIAGDEWFDAELLPDPIALQEGNGYDGQFFYRLALDPWTPEHREFGGTLDSPAWRHQRILYPVLTWLISLGLPRHVPEALVLVNLLALAAIGFAGGVIARRFELHAVWGTFPALYPGFFLTLVRDTAEIVAGACVAGAIASAVQRDRSRRWPTFAFTGFLCLAVLARETTVLIAVAAGLVWLWQRVRHRTGTLSWHNGIVPVLVMSLWHAMLYLRWDVFPTEQGSGNVGAPFSALFAFVREVADRGDRWESVWLVELKYLGLIAMVTIVALWWSRAEPFVKVAYGVYFSLAIVLTRQVWIEDWSFMRALTELHLLAAVILLGAPRWLRIIGVLVWLVFARWMFVEVDSIR